MHNIILQLKEWPSHKRRPCQTFILLYLQILRHFPFRLEVLRQDRHSFIVQRVAAKLGRHEALDTGLDGCIDDGSLLHRVCRCNGGDDCILVFEGLQELGPGLVVGDAVDFELGWERGIGGVACEDIVRMKGERILLHTIWEFGGGFSCWSDINRPSCEESGSLGLERLRRIIPAAPRRETR